MTDRYETDTKPLCPRSGTPQHPAHLLANRFLDRVHEATRPYVDGDGELPVEFDKLVSAATPDDYMELYSHSARPRSGPLMTVTTWWWQCHTCGFVLPAQAVKS